MALRSVFGNRENREKKTLANREYFQTLINGKKDPVFLADMDGDLFLLNKSAQSLTGFQDEEIRHYHVRDIFLTLKDQENPLDVAQFSEFTARLLLADAGGYLIPVRVELKEIEGQKFLLTCFTAIEEPAPNSQSEPSTAKESGYRPEAPAAEPLVEKPGRWTIDFEHQARNLLNNILGFSNIIASDPEIANNRKLHDQVEYITKSGNKLRTLLNRISLGEADAHEIVRVPCSIGNTVRKACIQLDPVARQHQVEIVIRKTGDYSAVTDEVLLLDLLRFFIAKGLQFSRNEQIYVDIELDPAQEKVLIGIDNIGQDIPRGIINFIKRGNGIRAYDLGNPLLSQAPEMETALNILNQIDGRISFTTGPDGGEIVRIELPAAIDAETQDDLSRLEKVILSASPDILIVEDDKLSSTILRIFLRDLARVQTALSGNEALNIVEDLFNRGVVFKAVIMDIGLPKPWDGIQLKEEMEKRWPEYRNVPFIAQTAFTSKSYMDRITGHHFHRYLLKPVNRIDLLRCLVEAVT